MQTIAQVLRSGSAAGTRAQDWSRNGRYGIAYQLPDSQKTTFS